MNISEHLQVLLWVIHFPFCPLNIPFHDEPLGLSIVQLLCLSCVIFHVSYHNDLGRLVCHFLLNFSPFRDVGDMSKLQEQTNNIRLLTINIFKRNLCTSCSILIFTYALAHMNSLCPHHSMFYVIYFRIQKHIQSFFFNDGESSLNYTVQLRRVRCRIIQRKLISFAHLLQFLLLFSCVVTTPVLNWSRKVRTCYGSF